MIHRDITPANLMRADRLYVLDFGLAKSLRGDDSISMTGDICGTPSYMSPQQARGQKVDERTDVCSLGATLYELVTGQKPFEGADAYEVIRQVVEDEPPMPRRLDPDIRTIIQKAMEKEPARRYESTAAPADDLDRELRGEPIEARPTTWAYRLLKRVRRQPVPYGLSAAHAGGVACPELCRGVGHAAEPECPAGGRN